MRRRILSALLVAVMVFGAVASGAAIGAVGAQSTDGGSAAAVDAGVAFDHNDTHNETQDLNETEDGNETVADETDGNVTDGNVTDGNETDAFGQMVSAFVHGLQGDNETSGPFGLQVASFVLANNPAADKIPDHAGPPANKTTGPPANVTQGPPGNETGGPPEDAGPSDTGNGGGPPEDAGPPDDRGPKAGDS